MRVTPLELRLTDALLRCPTGFSRLSSELGTDPEQQECQPCSAGTECVLPACDICVVCDQGKYKDMASTASCRKCPKNTFNPTTGATAEAQCLGCPEGAVTTTDGRTSSDDCKCPDTTYIAGGATLSCSFCPPGGTVCLCACQVSQHLLPCPPCTLLLHRSFG